MNTSGLGATSSSSNPNTTKTPTTVDQFIKKYLQSRGYNRALAALESEFSGSSSTEVVSSSTKAPITSNQDQGEMEGITTSSQPQDSVNSQNNQNTSQQDDDNNNTNTLILSEEEINQLLFHAAESFCFLGMKNNEIDCYQKEFDILISYTFNTLDSAKTYFHAIAFVLFVYCYIGIIRFSHANGSNNNNNNGEEGIPKAQLFMKLYLHHFEPFYANELYQLNLLIHKKQLLDKDFLDENPFV